MATQLPVHEFLLNSENQLLLDVRAETEYAGGHIPGAVNLPLFNDDERAVVGTLYKNSGREASVLRGLEIAGPKLPSFVKQLRRLTDNRQVFLHCWRGGMRSESMGWLFELAGYKVFMLKGGYKA